MIGTSVGPYRILERLGEGGMGVLYKGEDLRLGRQVALKFLSPHLARHKESRRRFKREAQAASLLDHPNICTILDILETEDDRLCIVMPCYEGESLRIRIGRGALEIADAVDLAIQMLRGLSKAHAAGIIHRDIKPENLFITDDGVLKILDFGLARISDSSVLTRSGSLLGTLDYAAPEQIRSEEVGPAADLWAAGVTLYEMLTGEKPFRGDYEAAVIYSILQEEPVPIRDRRPDVPDHLVRLIVTTLLKEPSRRPASAADMTECLVGGIDPDAVASRTGAEVDPDAKFELITMGHTIRLNDGEYLIGRSSDVPISIVAPSVSRRHAKILIRGGRATLEDLASKNGTWIGGVRIESPVTLFDFEELTFGRVHAIFRSRGATTSVTTKTDLA